MAHKNSKLFDAIFIRPSDGSGSEDDESEATSDENLEEPVGLPSEDQNISISSLGLQNGLKLKKQSRLTLLPQYFISSKMLIGKARNGQGI